MAGCSIVFLMLIIFWPILLPLAVLRFAWFAIESFVASAAFPLFIISCVFGVLAAIDAARLLWRWYKQRDTFVFEKNMLVRPFVLAGIAFAFFVAMCVVAIYLFASWYQGSM